MTILLTLRNIVLSSFITSILHLHVRPCLRPCCVTSCHKMQSRLVIILIKSLRSWKVFYFGSELSLQRCFIQVLQASSKGKCCPQGVWAGRATEGCLVGLETDTEKSKHLQPSMVAHTCKPPSTSLPKTAEAGGFLNSSPARATW